MKKALKIIVIVFVVGVLVLIISILHANLAELSPVSQQPGPMAEEPAAPAEETPPPAESPPEGSPPGPIDWSKVEIEYVTELTGLDVIQIGYTYPFPGDSLSARFVYVKKNQYSPGSARQTIMEDIALRLAEIEQEERMKKEIEEAL